MTNSDLDVVQPSQNAVGYFARCWKIVRQDGQVIGLTDHDADLHVDNTLYRANAGITVSRMEKRVGFDDHGLDITGVLSHPIIHDVDLAEGLYDDAQFAVWLVDWTQTDNRLLVFSGVLGEVVHDGTSYRASLRATVSRMERVEGSIYQRNCSASLGDDRCGVDLSQQKWRHTVRITSIDGFVLEVSGFEQGSGWFKNGRVILADRSLLIRDDILRGEVADKNAVLVLSLWDQVPASLTVGASIVIEQGCDQTESTCRDRFANYLNFRGFSTLPTPQVLVQINRAR